MRTGEILFPAEAPLLPRPGVPELYRPVLLERHLFPAVAEAVSTLLGIPVGFLPGTVVGARWPAGGVGPGPWAVARLSVNTAAETRPAFLVQPLGSALEWGAIGLRRPPQARSSRLSLSETNPEDLSAYAEVCNVIACNILARVWEEQLERGLFILLEEVTATQEPEIPDGLVAVQGLFGYQERPAAPKSGPADYERRTAWLLALPEDLAARVLWLKTDGNTPQKMDWLLQTGHWRRTERR